MSTCQFAGDGIHPKNNDKYVDINLEYIRPMCGNPTVDVGVSLEAPSAHRFHNRAPSPGYWRFQYRFPRATFRCRGTLRLWCRSVSILSFISTRWPEIYRTLFFRDPRHRVALNIPSVNPLGFRRKAHRPPRKPTSAQYRFPPRGSNATHSEFPSTEEYGLCVDLPGGLSAIGRTP